MPYCDHHAAGAICLAFSTTDSLVKTPSRSRSLDSSSSQARHPLNNLAALARAQGQEEKAERLLIECLSIREKVATCSHV